MLNAVQVSIPSIGNEHETSARALLDLAKSYDIDCPQMADMASEDLKKIKLKYKQIDDVRKNMVQPIDEARRRIQEFFRHPLEWLDQAEVTLKAALTQYLNAEEQKRREEEAVKRKAAEAAAQKMREQAAVLAEQGEADSARALSRQADMLPAMIEADTPKTKLAGISSTETWTFEIIDAAQVPREYLMVDEAKLRKLVRALKAETNIPGVRVFSTRQIAARAG